MYFLLQLNSFILRLNFNNGSLFALGIEFRGTTFEDITWHLLVPFDYSKQLYDLHKSSGGVYQLGLTQTLPVGLRSMTLGEWEGTHKLFITHDDICEYILTRKPVLRLILSNWRNFDRRKWNSARCSSVEKSNYLR